MPLSGRLARMLCIVFILLLTLPIAIHGNSCVSTSLETSKVAGVTGRASVAQNAVKNEPQMASWAIVALTRKLGISDTQRRNTAIAEKIRPYAHKHNLTVIFFSEVEVRARDLPRTART
jgi:hypothetical protein